MSKTLKLKIDVDKTREALGQLEPHYAAESLGELLSECVQCQRPVVSAS